MSSIRLKKDINDKKKRSLILLCIITCICLVLCLIGYLAKDRTVPKLDFTYAVASVQYSAENPLTENSFLNGVTALDSKDGDLTKNIVVKSMTYGEDNKSVNIEYMVRDFDGNVATASRIYNLNGSVASVFIPDEEKPSTSDTVIAIEATSSEEQTSLEQTSEEVTEGTEANTESETAGEDIVPSDSEVPVESEVPIESELPTDVEQPIESEVVEPIESEVVEPTESEIVIEPTEEPTIIEVETTAEPIIEEITTVASGKPVLVLNATEATFSAGEVFDYTQFIAELYDDIDNYYQLYVQVWVENIDILDMNTPGDYELIFHVIDTDGNDNDAPRLMVHVV